ncbi:MAG: hypothetical protein E5V63_29625 [Mesorhizobium sp.]|nr:MAG: hypothetical protein E5V63_29625 [Mesorhizobium sp.]
MKTFHWPLSETLKNYQCGDIIVIADSIELAREYALEDFATWARLEDSRFAYWFKADGSFFDDYDAEQYAKALKTLAADLAKDPIIGRRSIFINGGE